MRTQHQAAKDLRQALMSLGFSPGATRAMLKNVEGFCHRHGPKRYADLLQWVAECEDALEFWENRRKNP